MASRGGKSNNKGKGVLRRTVSFPQVLRRAYSS
jgi:hypothetical protein